MAETSNYYIHPLYILITLVLGSIVALFLGFSVAYVYSRVQNGEAAILIPSMFFVNTIFLLGASYCLTEAKKAFRNDQIDHYQKLLYWTLGLSTIFLICQILAWQQLISLNIGITSSTMSSYLYVLSGVHFVHVIVGIPFLGLFLYDAQTRLKEPASILLYLSDEDKKRRLNLLSIYWHFIDALWIYLVVFFQINIWIS